MSATVAAASKKMAVSLLTNPKVLKTICGIVLGIIIIIMMPIVAVVSIFNGDIKIDADRLQQMVVENLSVEEQSKLQFVEDTMNSIDEKMKTAGFTGRVKEAQVLYVLALSDYANQDGFTVFVEQSQSAVAVSEIIEDKNLSYKTISSTFTFFITYNGHLKINTPSINSQY